MSALLGGHRAWPLSTPAEKRQLLCDTLGLDAKAEAAAEAAEAAGAPRGSVPRLVRTKQKADGSPGEISMSLQVPCWLGWLGWLGWLDCVRWIGWLVVLHGVGTISAHLARVLLYCCAVVGRNDAVRTV